MTPVQLLIQSGNLRMQGATIYEALDQYKGTTLRGFKEHLIKKAESLDKQRKEIDKELRSRI